MSSESLILNHLYSRGFTENLINIINPAIDDNEGVATFYLWNLSGQLVGYQQYRPGADKTKSNCPRDARYYTHRRGSKERVAIGGLETYHWAPYVCAVEGIFDAVPLWVRGIPCVFMCGIPDEQTQHFMRVQPKPVLSFLDPGVSASMKKCFTKFSDAFVQPEELGISSDLGDMNDKDVNSMIYLGITKLLESRTTKVLTIPDRYPYNCVN